MIIVNDTKARVTIPKEEGNLLQEDIHLLQGEESSPITREQLNSINSYVVFFKLTVKEGKKVKVFAAPKTRKLKKKTLIIPGQEIVEDPEEVPVAAGFETSFTKEDLKDKTAAELRALCRQHGMLVSGTRDILIKRLLQETSEK